MRQIAISVPNFSEGRDPSVVSKIVEAICFDPDVRVSESELDPDHNRAVVTVMSPPGKLGEALFRGARVAVELIDMNRHEGVHPCMGAVDVIPLIPYFGVSYGDLIILAGELGNRIADELSLPVYLYAKAARAPERKNLASFRNHGFSDLREKVKQDSAFAPDLGPTELHPTAGAVAIGVRDPLIAFNVVLDSVDVRLARRIAKEIRGAEGGLPGVKALGFFLSSRNKVQVSTTITDLGKATMVDVLEAVREKAGAAGVKALETEIVGPVPLEAVVDTVSRSLKLARFSSEKILEVNLES